MAILLCEIDNFLMETLRKLTCQYTEWWWGPEKDKAFENVKKAITAASVLRYFDPTKTTTVQVDASQVGLGAVLLQDCQLTAYASRALTSTEQQYAQIEKELPASLFGLEKIDQYVFRRCVIVQTDRKHLESIM